MVNKKILILLPGPRSNVVGGYKVVYQYGDFLKKSGFSLEYHYLCNDFVTGNRFIGGIGNLKRFIFTIFKFYKWYPFENIRKKEHRVTKRLSKEYVNTFDVILTTAVETLLYLDGIDFNKSIKVINFVQDYEVWRFSEEIVESTYKLPYLKNITISNILAKKITDAGAQQPKVIFNGIDQNIFKQNSLWAQRTNNTFLFMYHPSHRKGCDILLKTIEKYKERNANAQFTCFSTYPKPNQFPKGINYIYRPSKLELVNEYNKNKFFICSSRFEGFGLTPAEAMSCGSLVLTTDNGGVNSFIEDGVSGLYFNDFSVESMLEKLEMVESMDESRLTSIAQNGQNYINHNLALNKSLCDFKKEIL